MGRDREVGPGQEEGGRAGGWRAGEEAIPISMHMGRRVQKPKHGSGIGLWVLLLTGGVFSGESNSRDWTYFWLPFIIYLLQICISNRGLRTGVLMIKSICTVYAMTLFLGNFLWKTNLCGRSTPWNLIVILHKLANLPHPSNAFATYLRSLTLVFDGIMRFR